MDPMKRWSLVVLRIVKSQAAPVEWGGGELKSTSFDEGAPLAQ